jgi:hypothetical protein
MKKAYAAPWLVVRGDAVIETKASPNGPVETSGQSNFQEPASIGSVGFHL